MNITSNYIQYLINTLEENTVIVNRDGIILYTNKKWDEFSSDSSECQSKIEKDDSYFDVLKKNNDDNVLRGIQSVLNEEIEEFSIQFPGLTNNVQRYFVMVVRNFILETGEKALIITHRNVTKERTLENERTNYEKNMRHFMYFDELTKLPNRRWMVERIQEATSKGTDCAVLYLDIDGFKYINDIYGHTKGDNLLQKVADKLQSFITPFGTLARIGGDEFLIFVKERSYFELEVIARDIVALLEQPVVINETTSFSISISMGISRYPNDSQDLSELMRYADTSMYLAKKMRGSHFRFYRSEMMEKLSRRVRLEDDMTADLKEIGFHFQLQPQVNYATNELVGLEVLSRWQHKEYGYISPVEFIQIAEESGQILKLTQYLIIDVFNKISEWRKKYGFDKKVAINITPSILAQKLFFEDFFRLLEQFEIPPQQVELEITEDEEISGNGHTLFNVQMCADKGIDIAIDDFGTGYAMFKSLTHFPVNKIKMDRYFISLIGKDTKVEAIIKSMIDFAENMQCNIVAEGVETKEEADYLATIGCNVLQGYYIDKPLDMETFFERYVHVSK